MDDFDSKLESILGNPQIMEQVMRIANQLGNSDESAQDNPVPSNSPAPIPDAVNLRGLSNLLGSASIDKNQQALIRALSPYVGTQKAGKLERAMQAAKFAQMASGFFARGQFRQMGGG